MIKKKNRFTSGLDFHEPLIFEQGKIGRIGVNKVVQNLLKWDLKEGSKMAEQIQRWSYDLGGVKRRFDLWLRSREDDEQE